MNATCEKVDRNTYLVHLDTATHGTFEISLPKEINSYDHAERVVKYLVSRSTRASTAPKFQTQKFGVTDGLAFTVLLTYLGHDSVNGIRDIYWV